MQFNKKSKSLEKIMKKANNKTRDSKNKDLSKYYKNNHRLNSKCVKFLTNKNEIKNKYYSNYYDYFIKSKNFNNTISKINASYKFHTSSSINQDSNRSGSISFHKNNNIYKKLSMRNYRKKEKSMIDLDSLNTLNHQKTYIDSKFNLNSILKKDIHIKDKQKKVLKNKFKQKI